MAHEFESGLFVGAPAWHGLGVVLKDPPSIEDAIVAAGLDWNVRLAPLALAEDGRKVTHRATVRESDGKILGVVGPSWHPLQNREAFAWFQPMIDSGECAIEAAGSLRGGCKIWILASIKGQTADVVGEDAIRQFVLLAHGHDGSLAIRSGFTAVRVVCANTLSGALSDASSKLVKITHGKHAVKALEKVRGVMDVARAEFSATTEQLRELARAKCSDERLTAYVREVFAPGQAENPKAAARILPKVLPLFEAGRGAELPGVRGTMWGAFNAVTEFVTHERGRSKDRRVEQAWFGEGAKLADRALSVGLEFARAA
jgi:phage/plasmid-like protein (TIGR03299 family)